MENPFQLLCLLYIANDATKIPLVTLNEFRELKFLDVNMKKQKLKNLRFYFCRQTGRKILNY